MHATAKLFITGRSQALRLPKEVRFPGAEVFIRRDPVTGDVILSPKPASWSTTKFFPFTPSTPTSP
jgi:antitoxin VapB